jgi:hypothetical protein
MVHEEARRNPHARRLIAGAMRPAPWPPFGHFFFAVQALLCPFHLAPYELQSVMNLFQPSICGCNFVQSQRYFMFFEFWSAPKIRRAAGSNPRRKETPLLQLIPALSLHTSPPCRSWPIRTFDACGARMRRPGTVLADQATHVGCGRLSVRC